MTTLTVPAPLLAVRDVHKDFGQTPALRGIDLDVNAGEVLAIMGPSGSGKSTLLHCMAGVLAPDRGTVTFSPPGAAPVDLGGMSESQRSAHRLASFGFVFQFGQLLPELSATDNVSLPLLLSGTSRRAAVRASLDLLGRLGLSGHEDKLPTQLSGGQAQRVAIARAMVTSPAILFADEPTGSLDSLAAENVLTMLLELVREAGTTVVVITHDPRTAAYADREIVVRDGLLSGAPAVAA